MSGYDIDRKLVFVTLAIGEEYIDKCLMLVQSVMKFTSSDIYVVTDLPAMCDQHVYYFGSRLKIIDINAYELFKPTIEGKFNYHLKCIAMYMASQVVSESLIYIDADTFVFGWDKGISRFIHGHDDTLMCRFREKVCENTSLARFIPEKAKAHDIDFTTIEARLAVETIMVLTRGKITNHFLKEWKAISDYAIENNIDPFIEAFELAVAIQKSNLNIINVNNRTPFADNFRTLHGGKLISTNII